MELSDNLVENCFEDTLEDFGEYISNGENVFIFSSFWIDRKAVGNYMNRNIEDFSYVNCVENDTLYKILSKLIEDFLEENISTGYHTSKLKKKLNSLAQPKTVFLDNFNFVDSEDRNDLLYFLSREIETKSIFVGSNCSDLDLDNRVESSLMPIRVDLEYDIENEIEESSISTILFSQELRGKRDLEKVKESYREAKVDLLSENHKLLFDKTKKNWQKTGEIYSRFNEEVGSKNLSLRRVEMLIDDLEKLNLIVVDKIEGGAEGKTQLIKKKKLNS